MELRKFHGENMREALNLVRQELGDTAVILDARTVREALAPGEPPVERVEVWAHLPIDEAAPPVAAAAPPVPHPAPAQPEEQAGEVAEYVQRLQEQLQTVHAQIEVLSEGMTWLGAGSLYTSGELTQYIVDGIAGKLPVSGGIQPAGAHHVVALIGPTGVGKTTTTAKLAAAFAHERRMRVGIISADTQRVGAIDQMRTYCRLLQVPLEIVYTATEMCDALQRLSACQLVLVDTPGGSQRNPAYQDTIKEMLDAADPGEVHLVLSACSSSAVVRDVMLRFAGLHPDQVIFTKLDETPTPLEVLPLIFGSGMALSYLTAGPAVPADLLVASPETISRFLVGE